MEERTILSSEEVDAIIKSAQASSALEDLPENNTPSSNINTNALNTIIESVRTEIENKLTAILKKKIVVKAQPFNLTSVANLFAESSEKNVYTSFKLSPCGSPVITTVDSSLLDVCLNVLYGGTSQAKSDAETYVGKVGLISGEKIGKLIVDCLVVGCAEYMDLHHELYKSAVVLANASNIDAEEPVYSVEFVMNVDEKEVKCSLHMTEEFLIKMIPVKAGKGTHREKDFWRTAIKSEVTDSYVTVNSTMTDVRISVGEMMKLKNGDEIEIGDPTVVFVCLNSLKLFRAVACQSNDKVVVKIISQV